MFDDVSLPNPKVPLDMPAADAVQRLGKWIRVVGTIQLAFSGMALLLLMLSFGCGALAGPAMGAAVLLAAVIPVAIAAVFLLQGLRLQAAGEQFKNLADEHDLDYLELAFTRLKTVYVIDIIIGALMLMRSLAGAL
jgi:hypothetical protein